jgi:hypothetical protein
MPRIRLAHIVSEEQMRNKSLPMFFYTFLAGNIVPRTNPKTNVEIGFDAPHSNLDVNFIIVEERNPIMRFLRCNKYLCAEC